MTIFIKSIKNSTNEEWDRIWENSKDSTYFHSREFAELWALYTKGGSTPSPKTIIFSDGKIAVIPLSKQKYSKGLSKVYMSSIAGTYGGWLTEENLDKEHVSCLTNYMLLEINNIFWRLNPYQNIESILKVSSFKEDDTLVISLKKDFESIFKNWTKGHKSAVKKAKREGVKVITASSIEDWKEYYNLYNICLKRWGSNTTTIYKWELFNEFYNSKSNNIKLWLAYYEGKIIAGILCLYSNSHVSYWHSAVNDKYFYLKPMHLLIYDAIKDSSEMGYNWFDFNPSGNNKGVKAFKKSFGTISLSCPIIVKQSRSIKLSQFLKKNYKKLNIKVIK